MRIDKGQISGPRLMFALVCYIQSSALMTSFFHLIALRDSWIVILAAIILCTLLMWLYRSLMVMFPDLNLLQILEKVFGRNYRKDFRSDLYSVFFNAVFARIDGSW
jgi:spore germination protein KB